jgi:D-3-phosphoglycerate dehydrogenase
MIRIVIPDDEPAVLVPSQAYRKLDGHDVRAYDTRPATGDELIDRIRDAEIVINIRSSCRFDRAVLEACPSLRMISIWGTGTDNVDLDHAKQRGVRVTNTPAVAKNAVAEHTLMLMLAAGRRIIEVDRRVRQGKWPRAMITELHGKTLGLIGLGAIGTQVARVGKGIGMNVLAWTFHPSRDLAAEIGFEFVSFEDVLRLSDVVSIHVRQSEDTIGMISAKHFGMMKRSAIFINTARGAIVDQDALIEALRTESIAAAGLDVFEREPLPARTPFADLPNVVLTPHSAGLSPETTEAGLAMTIDNVFDFLSGKPANVVV